IHVAVIDREQLRVMPATVLRGERVVPPRPSFDLGAGNPFHRLRHPIVQEAIDPQPVNVIGKLPDVVDVRPIELVDRDDLEKDLLAYRVVWIMKRTGGRGPVRPRRRWNRTLPPGGAPVGDPASAE